MKIELYEALGTIMEMMPEAYAFIRGSKIYPDIAGEMFLYPLWEGTLVAVDVQGLPAGTSPCGKSIFGFHIHEGSRCLLLGDDYFGQTGSHYNPTDCPHPEHSGDFPPLFVSNGGKAFQIFYTDRFYPDEVVGKTVVIHDMPDDFHSQPSGNSGVKIACGEIRWNKG